MTWDDVVKRDDIVGGDLEVQKDEDFVRGPISKTEIVNSKAYFHQPWIAKMTPDGWVKQLADAVFFIAVDKSPCDDIGMGRVHFHVLGSTVMGIIFPRGGSKLEASKVLGCETLTD